MNTEDMKPESQVILTDKELKTLRYAITKMANLELRKRLNPKFSLALGNLSEILNIDGAGVTDNGNFSLNDSVSQL